MAKHSKPFLSIIIPTYNEGARILETLEIIEKFISNENYNTEVLVIDDGSADQTVKIVEKYQQNHPSLKLIKNPHQGKALTVRKGIEESLGKYVLFTDADLSTPIEYVKVMLNYLEQENYEIAIASREIKGAKRIGEPLSRHLMGRALNLAVQTFFLKGIEDTQCGFKLFKRDAAQKIFNSLLVFQKKKKQLKTAYTGSFDVEILLFAKKYQYKIKEIPVTWTYAKISKVNPWHELKYLVNDIFGLLVNKIKGKYR